MPKPWTWKKPKPIPTWQAQLRKPVHWQALPEVTPAQREAAAIERLVDQVMAVEGWEAPVDRYEVYESLHAAAVQELAAREAGDVILSIFRVIPVDPRELLGVPSQPRYITVPLEDARRGCQHAVWTGTARWAPIAAVIDHWHCIGR